MGILFSSVATHFSFENLGVAAFRIFLALIVGGIAHKSVLGKHNGAACYPRQIKVVPAFLYLTVKSGLCGSVKNAF